MGNKWHFVLSSFAITLLSCTSQKEQRIAPDSNYYLEIRTHQSDPINTELAEYLTAKIPQKKYTFTNTSGKKWPYYAAFDLDQDIPIDSLMAPHSHLHKMILGDSNSLRLNDDHLVRIDIMPYPDTLLNYQVQIFEMDSTGLTLTGGSGIHFIDTVELYPSFNTFTKFSLHDLLYDHYLKSIIRYSFK